MTWHMAHTELRNSFVQYYTYYRLLGHILRNTALARVCV